MKLFYKNKRIYGMRTNNRLLLIFLLLLPIVGCTGYIGRMRDELKSEYNRKAPLSIMEIKNHKIKNISKESDHVSDVVSYERKGDNVGSGTWGYKYEEQHTGRQYKKDMDSRKYNKMIELISKLGLLTDNRDGLTVSIDSKSTHYTGKSFKDTWFIIPINDFETIEISLPERPPGILVTYIKPMPTVSPSPKILIRDDLLERLFIGLSDIYWKPPS